MRAVLKKVGGDDGIPLAGAHVRLLRECDNQLLGEGISDKNGEALVIAVGIPVIDFTAAPDPATPANGNGAGNGAAGGTPTGGAGGGTGNGAPLVDFRRKQVAAKIEVKLGAEEAWPPDPDAIQESGQSWILTSDDPFPEAKLETGKILTVGFSFLVKPQP